MYILYIHIYYNCLVIENIIVTLNKLFFII